MSARQGKKYMNPKPNRKGKNTAPRVTNRQNKRAKGQRAQKINSVAAKQIMTLSECASEYAKAIIDPFGSSHLTPCIPDLYDLPSYKLSTRVRGTLYLGTAGTGFIALGPLTNCSDAVVPETCFGYHSNASYAGTLAIPASTATTGVTAFQDTRFPYIWTENRPHRMVACGLRIRYSGTELDRGGTIYATASASEDDVLTAVGIYSRPDTKSYPVTRNWTTISFKPTWPAAYEYSRDNFQVGSTGQARHVHLAFTISGKAGISFEYEIIRHHEFQQTAALLVPNVSRSHSDMGGLSRVRDFLGQVSNSEAGATLWAKFQKYIQQSGMRIAYSATQAAFGLNAPLMLEL